MTGLAVLGIGLALAEAPRAVVIAGWVGGPARMYGFVQVEPALAREKRASVGMRVTSSYLRYEVPDDRAEALRVDSPGLALAATFGYLPRRLSLGVSTGIEARRIERTQDDAGRVVRFSVGATASLDAYWKPDPRVAVIAGGMFSGANLYGLGRVGIRRQVVPLFAHDPARALWLGVDATAQGNADVYSLDGGVIAELAVVPWKTAFSVRGEYGEQTSGGARRLSGRLGCGLYRWF